MIDAKRLGAALGIPAGRAQLWAPHLAVVETEAALNTPQRMAAFLSQVAAESGKLTILEENLNYKRLMQIVAIFAGDVQSKQALEGKLAKEGKTSFPVRTPEQIVAGYAGQPEKFANWVYANQGGNGDEASGDGWRYRGRGLIQITARNNYKNCGRALKLDLIKHPELLAEPLNAARSAGWFWTDRGLNRFADKGDHAGLLLRVNGQNVRGLKERTTFYKQALAALS